MPDSFDPYREWLGLERAQGPLDHYLLLGVPRFTSDAVLIASAAQQRLQLLHALQSGPRGHLVQRLLNELIVAQNCLLDAHTKKTYDAALAGQLAATVRTAPVVAATSTVRSVAAPPPFAAAAPAEIAAPSKSRSWRVPLRVGGGLLLGTLIVVLLALVFARRPTEVDDVAPIAESPPELLPEPVPLEPTSEPVVIAQEASGEIRLTAADATLKGDQIRLDSEGPTPMVRQWQSANDQLEWRIQVTKPAVCRVAIFYSATKRAEDATYSLTIDGETVSRLVRASDVSGDLPTDEFFIAIRRGGKLPVTLTGTPAPSGEIIEFRSLRLTPAKRVFGSRE